MLFASFTNITQFASPFTNDDTHPHPFLRGKAITKPDQRAALCCSFQALYERLFEWLIKHINRTLSSNEPEQVNNAVRKLASSLVIGVLDIYGFEIFDNNRWAHIR